MGCLILIQKTKQCHDEVVFTYIQFIFFFFFQKNFSWIFGYFLYIIMREFATSVIYCVWIRFLLWLLGLLSLLIVRLFCNFYLWLLLLLLLLLRILLLIWLILVVSTSARYSSVNFIWVGSHFTHIKILNNISLQISWH
jgi:hypothetical protein